MSVAAPETANQFWVEFSAQVETIKNNLANPPDSGTPVFVLVLKDSITDLQRYATISTITLPPYDIKRSQDIIENLSKEASALDAKLHPKKKFAFTNRTKKPTTSAPHVPLDGTNGLQSARTVQDRDKSTSTSTTTSATTTDTATARDASVNNNNNIMAGFLPPGAYVISQRSGETIHVTADMLRANTIATTHSVDISGQVAEVHAQLFIKGNNNCQISVPALLGSVRIESTSDCTITLGACCTSVYLDSVVNCTIHILSHQLRIHECKDCKLYVRVHSHPIIEDCVHMGFAPYSFTYDTLDADIQTAGLQSAHHWNTVVDFRWHKTTRSPHWYEIVPAPAEGANTTGTIVGSVVDPVPSTLVAQEVAVRQAGVVSTEDPDEL